jgi:hypothetical protein
MNVEIGAEAALFPGKEYINGIAVAVYAYSVVNIKLHIQVNINRSLHIP